MPLSKQAIDELNATYTAKFVDSMSARPVADIDPIVAKDSFGAAGYVPGLSGQIGAGQEWTTTRLMKAMKSYGQRFIGKLYENSIKVKEVDLADDPNLQAAKLAASMSEQAGIDRVQHLVNVLTDPTVVGFDGDPLFGTHTHEANGASYDNNIEGTAGARAWYIANSASLIDATRTGEDYTPQVHGGPGSDIQFNEDAVAFGYRARKIFAPGPWWNSTRSFKALTEENLQEAIARQLSFKGDRGQLLRNAPTHLVVFRQDEAAARKLLQAQLVNGGDTNTMYNRLQLIVLDVEPVTQAA